MKKEIKLIFSFCLLIMFFIIGSNLREVKAETIYLHGWLSEEKGGEAMGNAHYGQKFYVCFEITGSESGTNISKYENYAIKYILTKPNGTQTTSQAFNKQKACWGVYDPQLGHYKMNLHLKMGGTEIDCNLSIDCVDVAPKIISQPSFGVVSPGGRITYSIMAQGTNNKYQWYRNGVKLSGATLSAYTTGRLYNSNHGDYYTCSVSNTGNSTIYSNKAYCYVRGYPTLPTVDITSDGKTLYQNTWAKNPIYIKFKGSQIKEYGSISYRYSWDNKTWYTANNASYAQDTAEKKLYVKAVNQEDSNLSSSVVICSFKKDGTKPNIQEVYANTAKARSSTIYVKGIADNLSGVSDISISDNPNIYDWKTNKSDEYKKVVNKNGIYYIAVRDNAGNISDVSKCNVENIIKQQKQIITAPDSISVIYKKASFYLKAKTSSRNKLSYSIDDTRVAIIDSNGKITVKGYGKTKIIVNALSSLEYAAAKKVITLTVYPKKMNISKVSSPQKKCIKVNWGKDKTVTGYELYLSTRKDFQKETFSRIYRSGTTSMFTGGLQSKKYYYIKIRAYKKIGQQKYYGAWSNVKSIKIK